MNNFEWNDFEELEKAPPTVPVTTETIPLEKSNFDWGDSEEFEGTTEQPYSEQNEDIFKNILRKGLQIPLGYAKKFPISWGPDIAQFFMKGEFLAGLDEAEEAAYKLGVPFNREEALKDYEKIEKYFPTQSNLEAFLEEKTGIPLTPKSWLDHLFRLGGTTAGFQPGSKWDKIQSGLTGPAIAESAREIGFSEPVSLFLGMLGLHPEKGETDVTKLLRQFEGKPPSELPSLGPLSRRTYPIAEEFLKELPTEPPSSFIPHKAELPLPKMTPANPLEPGRVKMEGKPATGLLPTREPPSKAPPSKHAADAIGEPIAKERFYNETSGGYYEKKAINAADKDVYKGVDDLYRNAEKSFENIVDTSEDLVSYLEGEISKYKEIPHPSDIEKSLYKAQSDVLEKLIIRDKGRKGQPGNIVGFKPIKGQTLLNQAKSLRKKIDFDFAHGNAKNTFRPFISRLEDDAIQMAEHLGVPQAIEDLNMAKEGYKTWVEYFDNDVVRKWRDSTNKQYEGLFNQSITPDNYNLLKPVLELTEEGAQYSRVIAREIVEREMKPYIKDPSKVGSREFNDSMRRLEAILPKEDLEHIPGILKEYEKKAPPKAKIKEPPKPVETAAGKYYGKKPEDIQKKMKTVSGSRELKEAAKTDNAKKLYDELVRRNTNSILKEGKLEHEFTGKQLYEVLNKEKNYELLSEWWGEGEIDKLSRAAKKVSDKEITKENYWKFFKDAAGYKIAKIIFALM